MKKSDDLIKVAVVGPECTGKSTISEQLAAHYNTTWVPEFSRSYCENLRSPCTWQDEINIFHGQLALEDQLIHAANKLIICDTTFITVKIWSEHVFGMAPAEVLEELPKHHYHLYLLMDIDLPWQDDPLRDFPDLREHFMKVWEKELQEIGATYQIISGSSSIRLSNAIAAIDKFMQAGPELP